MTKSVFCLVAGALALVSARPQFPGSGLGGMGGPPGFGGQRPPMGGPMGVPPVPKDLPPGMESALPAETVAQLKAIHQSTTLSNEDKHDRIDKLLTALPADVLDRIPVNPALDKLPQNYKDQLKSITRDKSLNWRQKMEKTQQLMGSLPENVKRMLPPPPPPGFEFLPDDAKAALKAVHENTSLGFRERYYKIKEIMDKLPAEIRAKLPPAPPAPPMA